MDIPIYYDPMIAKLVTWGANRDEAIDRMIRAIDEYRISGVETTLSFCRFALEHKAFRSGDFDTHFINKYFKPEMLKSARKEEEEIAALVSGWWIGTQKKTKKVANQTAGFSAWKINRS
jgi:acetyl/propionyl-CoA carboxylase alpha subunit